MLHRFAFSNFQSFRERTEVNWLLNDKVPEPVWSARSATGERASTVMAVIGANASGKTGLLKPLLFLDWFIRASFEADPKEPLPFRSHMSGIGEASEFELEWFSNGRLWRYVLRCTPQQVFHEALYVKQERMRYVFVRDWDVALAHYRVKQQEFGFAPSEARKVRANASLLATAIQYGVPFAAQFSAGLHVSSNMNWVGRIVNDSDQLTRSASHFAYREAEWKDLVRLIKEWDLGLSDITLKELHRDLSDGSQETFWLPFGQHNASDGAWFTLPFTMESSGTQSALILLSKLLPVLHEGGLAVIDEFENDLHPHMLEPILGLFADKQTNPHGAQLLFTCHAMEVLNILHKSQVMLVEKDEHNESSAWRLDSVEGIRSDDNFYAKYMAGAYGAVPQL